MIYIIGNTKEGCVKIGKTISTIMGKIDRVKQLQLGCPFPLYLLKTFELHDSYEITIHNRLKKEGLHIHGEWFKYNEQILNKVFSGYGFDFSYDVETEMPEKKMEMTFYHEIKPELFKKLVNETEDVRKVEAFINEILESYFLTFK